MSRATIDITCHHCGRPVRVQKPLTKRQQEIYDYVVVYQADSNVFPTLAEIAEHIGVTSDSTVFEHLQRLEDKGRIVRVGDHYSNTPWRVVA